MKVNIIILACAIFIIGCASGRISDESVSAYIIKSIKTHGADVREIDDIPAISEAWRSRQDVEGVQIYIDGDVFDEITILLHRLLGDPDAGLGSTPIATAKYNEYGVYSVRDKGVAVTYYKENNYTGVIIVRPQ